MVKINKDHTRGMYKNHDKSSYPDRKQEKIVFIRPDYYDRERHENYNGTICCCISCYNSYPMIACVCYDVIHRGERRYIEENIRDI